ncbi:MAG: transglutaminase-like domain-containing protein [Kiritimatiellia bacterium]
MMQTLDSETGMPGDARNTVPRAPPEEPFEQAGFQVVESSWDNQPLRLSRFPLPVVSMRLPRVAALRKRYDFLAAMENGKSEFEKLLRLRAWVKSKIRIDLRNEVNWTDPFVILDHAPERGFVCTQYAAVMQCCALAAGWTALSVHVDHDHPKEESSASHAVTEIWVNELRKWVVFDPMGDLHYEKDGAPLSVAELCAEYVADGGKNVAPCRGPKRERVEAGRRNRLLVRGEVSGYFWNKYIRGHEPFGSFALSEPDMQVGLIGDAQQGKVWWQGIPPGNNILHAIRRGALFFTRRPADVNPDIGTSMLRIPNVAVRGDDGASAVGPGNVRVTVQTYTPAFEAVLVSVDGGDYAPLKGVKDCESAFSFEWPLHEGENTLKVRTRNEFGILGFPSSVRVVLKKQNSNRSVIGG